ncbi:hypothetical protein [Roseimaritima ulvae]|uniref:Uncharacterized protein n=1 Tax=Roseimaritima ulvae TaxID=980254 RepID=A0A5B9QRP6_9BACT|nr:hypothetical protein [Roseimaritima ulvae]QEG40015.1 hypothetical protein UC8_20190 [Roseimaritima ulvae]
MPSCPADLLHEIGLLPPPLHTPWVGAPSTNVLGDDAQQGGSGWPLFWYDPPWHYIPAAVARQIVVAVDALKIPTAVLGRDLGEDSIGDILLGHTLTPYRPDRYGLQLSDLQSAAVVDVRLARARDAAGRYAYSRAQVTRWQGGESETESQPAGQESDWVPAPGWPPELANVDALAGKLNQLRTISPTVRCAVSVTPYRIQEELPSILAAHPDIVILRMDDSDEMTGVRMAAVIVAMLRVIRAHQRSADLWVVPPHEPTADDCVKMYALGVAAIGIDWWCQPLISNGLQRDNSGDPNAAFLTAASELLNQRTERITALVRSCGVETISQLSPKHLVTPSPTVAKRLGIGQ